jgi:hypothetical protein
VSNPSSSSTDATVQVDSVTGQTIFIPAEGDSFVGFPGDIGGPVFITGDIPLTASRRTIYFDSFAEVYAQPSTAASTSLMLNWYDQNSKAFTLVNVQLTNPGDSAVSATVSFGSNTRTVSVPGNGVAVVNFPGQIGGPVFITASGPILASTRALYNQSFNEVNAVPVSQASTQLEFSWYDQTGSFTLDNIHIGNPNSSTATVTVSLGGVPKQTVSVGARGEAVVNLGAVIGGPVTITSNIPVISSQRTVYNQSFNEVFAVPATLASTNLILNWYDQDNVSFKTDDVHLVNPSTVVSSTVTVKVGASSNTVTIPPGGAAHVAFSGAAGGPVSITATSPVTASARTIYNSSFNEVNAVPTP